MKKNIIITIIIIIIVALSVGLIFFLKKEESGIEPKAKSKEGALGAFLYQNINQQQMDFFKTLEINPFKIETNPVKKVKINPFE